MLFVRIDDIVKLFPSGLVVGKLFDCGSQIFSSRHFVTGLERMDALLKYVCHVPTAFADSIVGIWKLSFS
jgi:hypothetical protein